MTPPVTPVVQAPPPPPPTPPEELASQRATLIVEQCVNRYGSEAREALQQYAQVVPQEGPSADTPLDRVESYFFTFPGTSIGSCRTAHDRMLASPNPLPDLDAASTAYVTTLEALAPVLAEAQTYYERETFRDDGRAGAGTLHPRLVGALEAFLAASDALHAIIAGIERRAVDVRLAVLAADPTRRGDYLVERTISTANLMVGLTNAMDVEAVDGGYRITVTDPAPFHAAVDAYQQAADEMIAAPEAAAIDTGGSYRNYSRELVAEAIELRRSVESSRVFPEGDAGAAVRRVVNKYNQVVDAYNRMR